MILITDRPGVIPVCAIRTFFEKSVASTESFRNRYKTDLTVEENGKFVGYRDADTHTFWAGFAIGMRCAERLEGTVEEPE